jgi:hypothetical protein
MRTAEDCRRQVAEMNARAAKSPVRREQYLQMAQLWRQLEEESARAEGSVASAGIVQDEPLAPEAQANLDLDRPASAPSGNDLKLP